MHCHFTFVCIYAYMYVCISVPLNLRHLVVQMIAFRRSRARQQGRTLHRHRPQICSPYHLSLYAAVSSSFPLSFTQSRSKCLLTRQPFWLWSFTSRGPDPCPGLPRESSQSLRSAKQDSCAPNMWVLIGQHVHPMCMTKKLFSLLFNRRVHKNGTQPAQLSVSSAVLRLSVYSSPCSLPPSLSSYALFDMHSEAACILNVCPSYIHKPEAEPDTTLPIAFLGSIWQMMSHATNMNHQIHCKESRESDMSVHLLRLLGNTTPQFIVSCRSV